MIAQQLDPLDWLVAGAGAVALYVLVDLWVRDRRGWSPPAAADTGE